MVCFRTNSCSDGPTRQLNQGIAGCRSLVILMGADVEFASALAGDVKRNASPSIGYPNKQYSREGAAIFGLLMISWSAANPLKPCRTV